MLLADIRCLPLSFSCCHVWLFETPLRAAHQASLSCSVSWSLLKLLSIELMMPSNLLILCCPLLPLPSIFPRIRDFFFPSESALHIRWPEYWSFSFSLSSSNEYSELVFFRIKPVFLSGGDYKTNKPQTPALVRHTWSKVWADLSPLLQTTTTCQPGHNRW